MTTTSDELVVDASVATKWYLTDEDHAAEALRLYGQFVSGEADLWAPDYIFVEVPAAILVATRIKGQRISPEDGRRAIGQFLALGITTRPSAELITSAYNLAIQHDCAIYDALYLALAEQLDIPFITADRKLHRRVYHLSYVIWLGDYGKGQQ